MSSDGAAGRLWMSLSAATRGSTLRRMSVPSAAPARIPEPPVAGVRQTAAAQARAAAAQLAACAGEIEAERDRLVAALAAAAWRAEAAAAARDEGQRLVAVLGRAAGQCTAAAERLRCIAQEASG